MFSNISPQQQLPFSSPLQEISLSDVIFDSELLQNNISSEELEAFVQKHQERELDFPPIIVEKNGDNEFKLKFGFLSFMSANICQQETISAIILEAPKQNQIVPANLSNFNWAELNEIARAKAFQWLLQHYQYSTTQLSEILKEERSVISNQIRLLQLPQMIQDKITQGKLSKSHGLTLLRLKTEEEQLYFAERIEQSKLTIRELKLRIKERTSPPPDKAPEKISVHHSSANMGHIRIPFSSPEELQKLLEQLALICPSKNP